MQHLNRHLVGRQIVDALPDRLDRTLHVGLDDQRQLADPSGVHLREHLLDRAAGARGGPRLAVSALAEIRHLPSPRLVFHHHEVVAGQRRAAEPQDLDRLRRAGAIHAVAAIVGQRAHPAPLAAGDEYVADPNRAALHQHGGHRAAALLHFGLDHHAVGAALGVRRQLHELGLKHYCLFQLVEVGLLGSGHLDGQDLAAEFLDLDLVVQQLLAHPVRVGVGTVAFVDGDDERNAGSLGVVDRLDGLFHDPVIGGHHQDHDVGYVGTAGAHLGEGGVTRRVDESDLLARRQCDLVGADMLRYAAGFAARHVGLAQRVQQRRLAMVDMSHHRDHRRPRQHLAGLVGLAAKAQLDVGLRHPLHLMAELGGDQLRSVGIDTLGYGGHDIHLH